MKFLFVSEHGEIADLASYLLHVEGHDVLLHITNHDCSRIAEGIIPHIKDWYRYMGKGYIFVFDGCSHGDWQDWLREMGEHVVGGSAMGDDLENDRQAGQKWFREAGFDQPWSQNFTDADEVLAFVEEHPETRFILKQNGDAPKHLSHKGKFENSEDMIFHLRELKKSWNEMEFGKFDCDLMEVVEGLEVAASAFWNGEDWLRNSAGKVVGFLNFEEKKEGNDGTGETCGEMGTTFIGVDEGDGLFASILLRPEIEQRLRESGFRGVFDINCIHADGRLVALEPTCRFGVPASSYEFIEGLASPLGELLSALAKGINRRIEIHEGVGMVMCLVAKPFPLEVDVEPEGTSVGEKLWIMQDGVPVSDFTDEQRQHIHLYNFERVEDEETGEICYKVPTKSGYLLTVTGRGSRVSLTRDALIHYIKQNVFVPGMKYRTDIGARVEAVEMELEAAQ
jgi:phosphoribosylamine--glycine ligase